MKTATQQQLKLTISNPGRVASAASQEHLFQPAGGSIGAGASDTWQLSAHRTGVVAGHAEIRLMDGHFCLIDRSGRTFINSASQPVGRGRRARLSAGDIIAIGKYQLKASLVGDDAEPATDEDTAEEGWTQLVDCREGELQRGQGPQQPPGREPLEGLRPAPAAATGIDPLADLERPAPATAQRQKDSHTGLLADDPAWRVAATEVSDEYRDNRDVALGLPVLNGQGKRPRAPAASAASPGNSRQDASRQHIGGAPLLRGLGADLDFADSDHMRLFLEEAGQTLRATIEGLLALHQSEDSRHQALRTRLQPIEDNPLRLGQGREDTIQTLFASQRSPVHLSAPAAVTESLQGLRHHQQATRAAIREGLEAILHAFSPAALLRRFHGYRRGLQTGEDEPQWAWQMYQHYYAELSSSRQQGFERLFQEVFDQAYDHHLRQLQRESI